MSQASKQFSFKDPYPQDRQFMFDALRIAKAINNDLNGTNQTRKKYARKLVERALGVDAFTEVSQ